MENNIVISNTANFETTKENIRKDGLEKLCVLSDFDKTLTYATVENERTPSMISFLRKDKKYLGEDYIKRATMLAEKYIPIEFNPKLDAETKRRSMEKWWRSHLELLIEKKLNRKHFEEIITERKLKFREELSEIFLFLYSNRVPLIIISASGIGSEPIEMFFKKENLLYSNIEIISNSFLWDDNGSAVGYIEPIIHKMNKDNVTLPHKKIEDRDNVLLLGDSFDDVKMADNINYKNLLKVCFLGKKEEEYIEEYKEVYDVLILNDSSAKFVNDFLKSF